MESILSFEAFRLDLRTDDGTMFNLLDDISFSVPQGVSLGVVGESGCGKSMTSLAAMRLLPPMMQMGGGDIKLRDASLLTKTESEMYAIRGKEEAMVFQEPMTSLNPVLNIGFQIQEMIKRHEPNVTKAELRERAIELLDLVGISNPASRLKNYPHQFSGGMRQRVMIAIAIACHPNLLIADEPTTALDVTIQAQVLDIMVRLREGSSLMLITHNLGVVAETCSQVVVMYAGQIVERGDTLEVFKHPAHPYTQGLLKAIPTLSTTEKELYSIPGTVPRLQDFTKGCRYAPRGPHALPACKEKAPRQKPIGADHAMACYLEGGAE